ncbi:acylphosphatase [Desulfovibrio aminophilus]|uniref:acylphosphatase n=1 Tax=Desulfovibrio aminophilus TaxID=81425 RepID=UPI003398B555
MSHALHCVVEGKVQGVFFRAFTRDEALRLGLTGWVRNLADGRVEAVARGPEAALAAFKDFLHRGSPMARVDSVHCEAVDDPEEFNDFEIRR